MSHGKRPKALLIGIDGCRPDALMCASTPCIKQLMRGRCAYSLHSSCGPTTLSGPSWSTVWTGLSEAQHNVRDNRFSGPACRIDECATVLRLLKEKEEEAGGAGGRGAAAASASAGRRCYTTAAVLAGWAGMRRIFANGDDADELFTFFGGGGGGGGGGVGDDPDALDAKACSAASELLAREEAPDCMVLTLDSVDCAGHAHGFSPTTPEYVGAIERVDAMVGALVAQVEQRQRQRRRRQRPQRPQRPQQQQQQQQQAVVVAAVAASDEAAEIGSGGPEADDEEEEEEEEDWLVMLVTDHGGTARSAMTPRLLQDMRQADEEQVTAVVSAPSGGGGGGGGGAPKYRGFHGLDIPQHRASFFLAANAARVQRGELLPAPSGADVAPSVLHHFGIQPPAQMEGMARGFVDCDYEVLCAPSPPPAPLPPMSAAALKRGAAAGDGAGRKTKRHATGHTAVENF